MKGKVKSFGFDIVDIEFDDNQTCQWALWKNPKSRLLPRIKDYSVLKLFLKSGDFKS